MDKIEMSLDDIIKQSKEFKNTPRRGRGRGDFYRGGETQSKARGDGGHMRSKRGRSNSAMRTPYSRSSGDINSRWQHDMYDGPAYKKRRRSGGPVVTGSRIKLVVTNLDYGVSTSDIQELFSEFGPLHSVTVDYDKSGRSMGSANVVYERKADAVKALKQYNTVPLDGQPMHIELATSDVAIVKQQANRVSGDSNRRTSAGRYGRGGGRGGWRRGSRGDGRGDGRGAKTNDPTVAELDAELDAYVSKRK